MIIDDRLTFEAVHWVNFLVTSVKVEFRGCSERFDIYSFESIVGQSLVVVEIGRWPGW